MKILVVGATGATGRLLVQQLLDRDEQVKAVVRSISSLPEAVVEHPNLTLVEGSLLDFSEDEMAELVQDCRAVASCLGHNLTFQGLFGQPRRLVTEAVRRLCEALRQNGSGEKCQFVLMNTTGVRNRDLDEPISSAQKMLIGLLRVCLPPHADNEDAADYLRVAIGQGDEKIEWVAVRPDSLIDCGEVSEYTVHPSPTRSALFDPGKTSRINVAHFMATLLTDADAWREWRGQMPVIYRVEEEGS